MQKDFYSNTSDKLERSTRIQSGPVQSNQQMATRLQRYYRYYLRREYGRAVRLVIKVKCMLHLRCSLVIQSFARLVAAKRRARVENSLCTIRDAHPSLVMRATDRRIYPGKAVYRYTTYQQVQQQYEHYLRLGTHIGNHPVLQVVQDDILTIVHRISARQERLATRIQSLWRGVVARVDFRAFKRSLWDAHAAKCSFAIRIQRRHRGCKGRQLARVARLKRTEERLMESYKSYRRQQKELREVTSMKETVRRSYVKGMAEYRYDRYMNGFQKCSESESQKN